MLFENSLDAFHFFLCYLVRVSLIQAIIIIMAIIPDKPNI